MLDKNVAIYGIDGVLAQEGDGPIEDREPIVTPLLQARIHLRRADTNVVFITSRDESLRDQTMSWCNRYLEFTTECVNPPLFFLNKGQQVQRFKANVAVRAVRRSCPRPALVDCYESSEEALKRYNAVLKPMCRQLRLFVVENTGKIVRWNF